MIVPLISDQHHADFAAVCAAPEAAAAEHPGRRLRVQPPTHPPPVAAGRTGMAMAMLRYHTNQSVLNVYCSLVRFKS